MHIEKAVIVLLFGVVVGLGFQSCTSNKGTSSQSPAARADSASQAPASIPTKCQDGSDPIEVPGVCEGTWSPRNAAKNGPSAADCQFIGKLANCETAGYANFAGDGRNLCYGEVTFPYGGQSVTADQCLKKHGMPSHASKYTLRCCKK